MNTKNKKNFEELYQTILENAALPPTPAAAASPETPAELPVQTTINPDDPVIQKALSVILAYGAGKVTNTQAAEQIQALLVAPAQAQPAEVPAAAAPTP